MRPFLILVALLSFAASARAQNAPSRSTSASLGAQGMFPFVPPTLDDTPNVFDLSYLNEKPAGARGFVRASGENFVDGSGKILRLWGVNLNFEGTFPDKTTAPKIAGRLAKFGFNTVRLHHFEGNAAPRGIWKAAAVGSTRLKIPREIDADQLDRLDFFVAELIKRGIYINWNLHVARKVVDGEGIPNAGLLPDKDKGMGAVDASFERANQAFARFLLLHVNPYTGRAYKDEPGVCAIEVDNESSVLALWLDGSLNRLPNPYAENLRVKWNDWLLKKYGSEAALSQAWTEIDTPISGSDLLNPPLPVATPSRNEPQILPESTDAPTILGQADGILPDGTVAPPPPVPQLEIPTVAPEITAGLDRWKLNLAGGAVGTAWRDDLGGPAVNGFVQPGLALDLSRAGSVSWAFQLVRDGLTLEDNKPYTLTFWGRSDSPRVVSLNLWQDFAPFPWLGYTGQVRLTRDWQQFTLVLRAIGAQSGRVRLALNVSNQVGNLQLGGFSLRAGGKIAAPDTWNVRNGIPLPDAKSEPIFAVRRDFALFLGELEAQHVAAMRRFLILEMGIRVPIWHTQAQFGGWGGQRREQLSDAIDTHIYWKHPDFGGAGWNGSNWRVENLSMAATPLGDPLAATAMLRVPGKPFVVSEFNSGQPNDFGAESLPMLAAFAAWQGWAGAWIFDYHSSGAFDRDKIEGYFSIDSHPAKMATAPLAALLFRRQNGEQNGDVAPAKTEIRLNLPDEIIWSEVANTPGVPAIAPFLKTWKASGAPRGVALLGRAATSDSQGLFAAPSIASANESLAFQSDTGELKWDGVNGKWSAITPRNAVVAGFVGGRKIALGETQFWVAPSSNWATMGVTSLDNLPLQSSKKLLLTATGRAENVGMGWNADRSSVGLEWGTGPTHVAGITSVVKMASSASQVRVFALNERGERRGQLNVTMQKGAFKFSISPVWRTVWYEIELS
jgi:hypothetical protein